MAKNDETLETNVSKRNRKDLHPQKRLILGSRLKDKRIELSYSLNDIALISDMSKAMAWSVEMGKAKGIDYYIEYAGAVGLNLFEGFQTDLTPRYELPEKNKKRIFLTARIRELAINNKLFMQDTTVKDIITLLAKEKGIQNTKGLSSKIAGILRNWVEEDGILVKRKEGGVNIYSTKK